MEDYLEKHNVATILKSLVAQLCIVRPEQPVPFMIDYLRKNFVDTAAPALPSKTSFAPPTAVEQKSAPMDTEHDDEEEEDEDRETHEAPKKEVGAPRRRGGISAEAYGDEEDKEPLPPSVPKGKEINERLESTLKDNIMFSHLSLKERIDVYSSMKEVNFKGGDVIIREGDEGDNFYVVDSGHCDIFKLDEGSKTEKLVMQVAPKGSFGELALIYNCPRAATVKARTDVRLWALDRVTYRRKLMNATKKKRSLYESFLARVPILSQLNKYERLTVADALQEASFKEGEVIVRQGERGDIFYIILEGEVSVTQKQSDGVTREVARLKTSDYFGEIALLTERPRAATVTSVGPVRCVQLDRARFNRVMGPCEDILRRNMEEYNKFMATNI
eukprot:TRINITY_DN6303_c0_g1_i4.p1 TRINITY_DN6303_c0_g1~~TRINITY_DN6303_c0_g1_i4.p1  ORF type:complete len:388 (+),score=30.05 TRINITY_DN6303_c0_g1_i4:38-1201(+)